MLFHLKFCSFWVRFELIHFYMYHFCKNIHLHWNKICFLPCSNTSEMQSHYSHLSVVWALWVNQRDKTTVIFITCQSPWHWLYVTRGYSQRFTCRVSMHEHCHVLPRLTELSCVVVKSKTHRRLNRMLFNQTMQDRMKLFEGILFFKATNYTKTNKSLSCCQLGTFRKILIARLFPRKYHQ